MKTCPSRRSQDSLFCKSHQTFKSRQGMEWTRDAAAKVTAETKAQQKIRDGSESE